MFDVTVLKCFSLCEFSMRLSVPKKSEESIMYGQIALGARFAGCWMESCSHVSPMFEH